MAKTKTDGIQDFGQHIGGAKKELFAGRNLMLSDLENFDAIDVETYVNKNKIWKTPKWEEYVEKGYDKSVLYFMKLMRDAFPPKPKSMTPDEGKAYCEQLEKYRDAVMGIKTMSDVRNFNNEKLKELGLLKENEGSYYRYMATTYYDKKMDKAMRLGPDRLKEEAIKKNFLYTPYEIALDRHKILDLSASNVEVSRDYRGKPEIAVKNYSSTYFYRIDESLENLEKRVMENNDKYPFAVANEHKIFATFETREQAEQAMDASAKLIAGVKDVMEKAMKEAINSINEDGKETSDRKQKFKTEPLAHIDHVSPFGDAKEIVGDDFVNDFNIRGGEFGNWLNENDRQENMNAAYDAFQDLARALDIADSDIGIGGKLNIAFGARGSSRALAHYESAREVINLTKMKGAGSLAHEFFHALDNIYAKSFEGYQPGRKMDFATEYGASLYRKFADVSPAAEKLMNAIMYKELTPEEAEERKANNIKCKREEFDKDIKRVVLINLTPEQREEKKEDFDKLMSYLNNLVRECEGGRQLREFKFTGRGFNGKWVTDAEELKKLQDLTKELGFEDARRYAGYLLQEAERLGHSITTISATDMENIKQETKFYLDAKEIDKGYSKSGHGYWQSSIEMAARAFACYVYDKLEEKGIKNDYLCGHAFMAGVMSNSGDMIYPYPLKEERETINKAFDGFIKEMKEKDILHDRDYSIEKTMEVDKGGEPHTIAVSGNKFTITNNTTKEQQSLSYSSSEKAMSAFENAEIALSGKEEKSVADEVLEDDIYKNFEDNKEREDNYQYSFFDYMEDR